MNTIELYRDILAYYLSNRGVGHTKATIKGVDNTLGASIIVTNRQQVEYIAKYMKELHKVETLDSFESRLRGIRKPIVFDNNAIQELLIMGLKELEKLDFENRRLRFINDNFKEQCHKLINKSGLIKDIVNKKWTNLGKLRKIKSVLNQ